MRCLSSFLLTAAIWTSAPAMAQMSCHLIAATPAALSQEIFDSIFALGVSELPPMVLPGLVTPDSGRKLLREGSVVASVRLTGEPVMDHQELVVLSASGSELAHSMALYENGKRVIRFWTARDPVRNGDFPLSIIADGGYVRYFRYGNEISSLLYFSAYLDMKAWLFNVFAHTTDMAPLPVTLTQLQRLQLTLAARPELQPYYDRLRFYQMGKILALYGVLPYSSLVGIVIQEASRAGFDISNQLVIDTSTSLIDSPRRLYACP